jgi:hypothetical protein
MARTYRGSLTVRISAHGVTFMRTLGRHSVGEYLVLTGLKIDILNISLTKDRQGAHLGIS